MCCCFCGSPKSEVVKLVSRTDSCTTESGQFQIFSMRFAVKLLYVVSLYDLAMDDVGIFWPLVPRMTTKLTALDTVSNSL